MASRELSSSLRRLAIRDTRSTTTTVARNCRRYASSGAAAVLEESDFRDLESESSLLSNFTPDEKIKAYDPAKRAQGRTRELPPSRYGPNGLGKHGIVANSFLKLSISTPKILSRTSPSSSTSSKVRPIFTRVHTRSLLLYSSRTNLPVHNRVRSHDDDLCSQTARKC